VHIAEVKIGQETVIDGKTLYIRKDLCQDAIHAEAFVTHMTLDIITPAQYGEYGHTIMDVQPIAVKESGAIGEGGPGL
jgi:D-proline reductase (dithiol) PrdA